MSYSPVKISIAMSTLNGAQYIEQQLHSLANQSFMPHELVVSDDFSSDNTLQLLEDFKRLAPFPVIIIRQANNVGFSESFFRAASACTGNWIAFCDQDDFWLPDKLLRSYEVINSKENNLNLVLQNSYLADHNLKVSGRIFPRFIRPGYYKAGSQYCFWVWPGFLQTVKAELFQSFPTSDRPLSYFPDHIRQPHDKWTCMLANALGGIVVLDEPVALYRRHPNTVTGNFANQTFYSRIKKSLVVSSDYYFFLSEVADSSLVYLRNAADLKKDSDVQAKLLSAALSFDKIRKIQLQRANVYSRKSFPDRVRSYFNIMCSGGYLGPRCYAMGGLSSLKDFFTAIGILPARL